MMGLCEILAARKSLHECQGRAHVGLAEGDFMERGRGEPDGSSTVMSARRFAQYECPEERERLRGHTRNFCQALTYDAVQTEWRVL